MIDINEKLKELQPYVVNIRFPKGLSVIDAQFKDGWTLPTSKNVGFEPIPKNPNFFMLYGLNEGSGVSELISYIEVVIKLNVEREMKYKLLNVKVKELEQLFSVSSLDKCNSLEFTFKGKELSENLKFSDIPLIIEGVEEVKPKKEIIKTSIETKKPIVVKNGNEVVELPPIKEKIVLEEFEVPNEICNCGPNEACSVCITN